MNSRGDITLHLLHAAAEARAAVATPDLLVGGRVLSDGKRIGSIKSQGVPVTLTPESFGPGYSRLEIIRVLIAIAPASVGVPQANSGKALRKNIA